MTPLSHKSSLSLSFKENSTESKPHYLKNIKYKNNVKKKLKFKSLGYSNKESLKNTNNTLTKT